MFGALARHFHPLSAEKRMAGNIDMAAAGVAASATTGASDPAISTAAVSLSSAQLSQLRGPWDPLGCAYPPSSHQTGKEAYELGGAVQGVLQAEMIDQEDSRASLLSVDNPPHQHLQWSCDSSHTSPTPEQALNPEWQPQQQQEWGPWRHQLWTHSGR
jgi:hypothetical protein